MKFAEAPRLPKLPFILGDIALLLLAAGIAVRRPTPWSHLTLLAVTGCVVAGAIASFIPYLVNYARDQEVAAASLRHELGEQFKRLMLASEHFQHATVELKAIEDAATKGLETARDLPRQIGERIDEFHRQLGEGGPAAGQTIDPELRAQWSAELGRLSALAEKLAALASDWADREADARRKLADAARLEERLADMLAAAEVRLGAPANSPAGEAAANPVPAPEPSGNVGSWSEGSSVAAESAPADPPEPEPRAAQASAADPANAAPPEVADSPAPPPELVVEPLADEAPAPDDFSQVPPEEGAPVRSDDGSTRLTVTAYVGIGNKLYLRGDGPGLRWDKGVPLQFVSIGRWQWETREATESFTCQLYKNDKIQSPLGLLTLTPGVELEVTATF